MLSLFPIALITIIFRRFFETVHRQPSPPQLNIGSYTSAFVIFSALFLYFYTHAHRGTAVTKLGNVKKPVRDRRVGRNTNYVHKRNSVPESWFIQKARGSRENQKQAVRYVGEQFLRHLNESDSHLNLLSGDSEKNHDPVIVSKISALPNSGGIVQQPKKPKPRSNLTKTTLDSFKDEDLGGVSKSNFDVTGTSSDSFGYDRSPASTSSNINSQQSENDLDVGIYGAILETKNDDDISDGSSIFFLDQPRETTVADVRAKSKNQKSRSGSPKKCAHDRGDVCRQENKKFPKQRRNRCCFVRRRNANKMKYNNITRTTRSGRVYGFFQN